MPHPSEEPKVTRPRYTLVAAIATTIILGVWVICVVERQESITKPPCTSSKQGRTRLRDTDSFTEIERSTPVFDGLERI
jgi:hypothetical protein